MRLSHYSDFACIAIVGMAIGCGASTAIPPERSTDPVTSAPIEESTLDRLAARYRFVHSMLDEKEYAAAKAALPFTEIQFERTACFGECPSYIVTLHVGGAADYVGREHVPNTGNRGGEVGFNHYGRLSWLIEKFMLQHGTQSYSANWTDDASAIIRVKRRGSNTAEVISDYGMQGPIELWAIHNVIDGLVSHIEWKPSTKLTPSDIPVDLLRSLP